jgi:hypothetical protein
MKSVATRETYVYVGRRHKNKTSPPQNKVKDHANKYADKKQEI